VQKFFKNLSKFANVMTQM